MSVTPQFIGQRYKDTNTGSLWIANSLTAGDWTLEYEPQWVDGTTFANAKKVGIFANASFGATQLIVRSTTSPCKYSIQSASSLTDLQFPVLVTLTGSADFLINLNANLASLSAPLLQSVAGDFQCLNNTLLSSIVLSSLATVPTGAFDMENNNSLVTLSLPAFITEGAGMSISNNDSLANLSMPVFLPTNGQTYDFSGNNLSAASVNAMLARGVASAGFVSGVMYLNFNASAPTGQGIIDKGILNARQPGLAVTD